jgi:hypothetical protein
MKREHPVTATAMTTWSAIELVDLSQGVVKNIKVK